MVAAAGVDRANAIQRAILGRGDGGALANGSEREAPQRREQRSKAALGAKSRGRGAAIASVPR